MNFLIMNQHTMNFGDDIAGEALIQEILQRFPNKETQIEIIYNTKGSLNLSKEQVKDRHDISLKKIGKIQLLLFIFFSLFHVPIVYQKTLKKFRSCVEKSDVIFVSPCGANIGIYKDWRFLLKLYITVKFGGKLIFHNNTIGKSNNMIFNLMAFYVLKRSSLFVREKASYDYLKSKGLFSIRSVDTGFLFQNKNIESPFFKGKYTVFIPTEINSWHPNFKGINVSTLIKTKVLEKYASFAQCHKLKIVILPHLYDEKHEVELYQEYRNELIKYGVLPENIFVPEIKNCHEYNQIISNGQFVLSMRYHGVVMAIKNNVPFLSLAYENKMEEVCQYASLSELNINIKNLDFQEVDFDKIWAQKVLIKEQMIKSNVYLKDLAETALKQIEFLATNKIS